MLTLLEKIGSDSVFLLWGDTMYCQKCGEILDEDAEFCGSCGCRVFREKEIKKEEIETIGGIDVDILSIFLGSQSYYYVERFRRIEAGCGGKSCPGWLFVSLWLIYKKMYGHFFKYTIVQGILTLFQYGLIENVRCNLLESGEMGSSAFFVFVILVLKFIYWLDYATRGAEYYFEHVQNQIHMINPYNENVNENQILKRHLQISGSSNPVGVILIIILSLLLPCFLTSLFC